MKRRRKKGRNRCPSFLSFPGSSFFAESGSDPGSQVGGSPIPSG